MGDIKLGNANTGQTIKFKDGTNFLQLVPAKTSSSIKWFKKGDLLNIQLYETNFRSKICDNDKNKPLYLGNQLIDCLKFG